MKKVRWSAWGYVVLFVLAGMLLLQLCRTTNQAMMAYVFDLEFKGEYSLGESEWQPLEQHTKFSSFDGDLVLRGQFDEQINGIYVSFYLNHIGVSISVNGEEVYESGRITDEIPEMMCGSYWSSWLAEGVEPEDEVEIRLHNPHRYGNAGAYQSFLNSLHLGAGTSLVKHLKPQSMPYQVAGVVILVVSIALLGMSLGYSAQRLPVSKVIWSLGWMSFFMSIYILMDRIDIEFYSTLIVFNTCVRQLCIMFAAMELVDCVRKILTGRKSRITGIMLTILCTAIGILLILSLANRMAIYDTGCYWAIVQGAVSLVLIGFCIQEYRQGEKVNKILLISYMVLLSAVLLELIDARMNWWTSGIVVKAMFILLFVVNLIRGVIIVSVNQRESQKAKELESELKNSRIVLAMSQIRTHFIFNILTAISGMCEYDPEKADETLIRFSRYLRNNIDIMQEDALEPFSKSLEHLEDYIALEQIRFGNKIQFVKNLEITEFKLPPLVLQPIVENSIKHGLFPKQDGGTIELHTQKNGDSIWITITDDGVGYDMANVYKKESVGLDNVRFRLKHMINGRLDIESSQDRGTKVTIIIPCKGEAL